MSDSLVKKLILLKEALEKSMSNSGLGGAGSVKAGAVLPNRALRIPKPGNNSLASKVKIPSIAPQSKKDPIKSIQQVQNKDIKDLKMKEAHARFGEVMKTLPNGQWSLDKGQQECDCDLEKRCWEGYKPTPGKKAYSDDSCQPIKKKECQCEDMSKSEDLQSSANDQWSLEKSKYPGVYDINDNARRKANNVDAEQSPIQASPRVKKWGGSGVNAANREAQDMKIKSKKSPVKSYSKEDYSPEEWGKITGQKVSEPDNVIQLPQVKPNEKKAA
jgi:hypothetical protein